MSVKVCRLVSGEDIIADVEVDHIGYLFTNPAPIVVQQ